ncbi:hypothetical protein A0J61_05174 [Choanephora cucurbitarum]|uniref:BHLH domain-containing protein n=1 Tax=Choanephora cucurbitarum TaxID=101091 RepID=A0A1C7NCG4_9FUNG|nr:hypothetical protein A0J61_05174 [Choanephora cucurbitarum]
MPKEQKLNENRSLNKQQESRYLPQHQQVTQMPTSSASPAYPFGISFSSSMSHTNESDDIAYIEKRTAHNALERQRREGLNTKFQELAHVLPSLQQIRRPSKSMIVAKSLEFVSMAQEREADYQDQLRTLRRENEQLMRQAVVHQKKMKKRSERESKSKSPSPIQTRQQPVLDRKREASPSNMTVITTSTDSTENTSYAKLPSIKKKKKTKAASKMKAQQKAHLSSPHESIQSTTSSPSQEYLKSTGTKRSRNEFGQSDSVSPLYQLESAPDNQPLLSPPLVQSMPDAKKRKTQLSDDTITLEHAILPSQQAYSLFDLEHQAMLQSQFMRQRYNSLHSVSSSASSHVLPIQPFQPSMLSPAVSRSNSLTINDPLSTAFQTEGNDMLVNLSSSLDVTSSPFGAEQVFHDTLDHVVSSVPAIRTPIGSHLPLSSASSSPSTSMIQPQSLSENIHYDPTLDLLSFMQPQNHSSERKFSLQMPLYSFLRS